MSIMTAKAAAEIERHSDWMASAPTTPKGSSARERRPPQGAQQRPHFPLRLLEALPCRRPDAP